jgi:hypothetical protein
MLLFIAIVVSVLWLSGCVLGLALGAMLARADGRAPVRPARGRRARAQHALPVGERMLPTA